MELDFISQLKSKIRPTRESIKSFVGLLDNYWQNEDDIIDLLSDSILDKYMSYAVVLITNDIVCNKSNVVSREKWSKFIITNISPCMVNLKNNELNQLERKVEPLFDSQTNHCIAI